MRGLSILACVLLGACGDVVKSEGDTDGGTSGSGSFAPRAPADPASCGDGCLALPRDTVLTLFATPAEGSRFAGWAGACSGDGDCTITMDRGQHVIATFVRDGDASAPREVALPTTGEDAWPLVVTTHGDGRGRVTWR